MTKQQINIKMYIAKSLWTETRPINIVLVGR